ncbi:hypothetical protein [Halorubrum distributum]|uniref:hypothetical protein n=1 Tax=Halorubrum distributum TaxID=29283 RepID=UPI001267BC26|nr:hypothetical protein [Halorubrum arcis]
MGNNSITKAEFIQVCQYFGQEVHFTEEAKHEIKEGMRGRCFDVGNRFKIKHEAQSELEEELLPHFDMKVVYTEPEEEVRITDDTQIQVDDIVDRPYHPPASSRRE